MIRSLNDVYNTIDAAVIRYAQTQNLQFSTRFYQRLPRELRDMCYAYLLDEMTLTNIGIRLQNQVNSTLKYSRVPLNRPPTGAFHIIDPSFTHPGVAAEILALAAQHPGRYRGIASPHNARTIERILAAQPFELGVPAAPFYADFELLWRFGGTVKEVNHRRHTGYDYALYTPAALDRMRRDLLAIPVDGERGVGFIVDLKGFTHVKLKEVEAAVMAVHDEMSERGFKYVRCMVRQRGMRGDWRFQDRPVEGFCRYRGYDLWDGTHMKMIELD